MTAPTLKGAAHVFTGGLEFEYIPKGNRRTQCSWSVLRYWDQHVTEEHRDYFGVEMGEIDVQLDLFNGNYPDGLWLADEKRGIAYRVTGGKLVPAFRLG